MSFYFITPLFSFEQKSMATTIRRNLALKEYDIKETPEGNQVVFSIKFIKKDGELVFVPAAVACGLTANMKKNRLRGIMPVDNKGNRTGDPYPVSILEEHYRFITEFPISFCIFYSAFNRFIPSIRSCHP